MGQKNGILRTVGAKLSRRPWQHLAVGKDTGEGRGRGRRWDGIHISGSSGWLSVRLNHEGRGQEECMDSSSRRRCEAGAGLAGSSQLHSFSLLPVFGHLQPGASGHSAPQGVSHSQS